MTCAVNMTAPNPSLPGLGNLPKLVLVADDGAAAEIYLHGAHVAAWRTAGADRLFLSATSKFEPGVPIRGGVPVCFPQFANQGPLPMHGLVRTVAWQVDQVGLRADGAAQAVLRLEASATTNASWPHAFALDYTVTVHGRVLSLALCVSNTGNEPLSFTGALHTYLRVGDIRATQVQGLQGVHYRDKFLGTDDVVENAAALAIDRPLDRVYYAAPANLTVVEPGRSTAIRAEGFPDTVVWNPGPERAAAFADLEPGGWERMLCVEAAAARTPVLVEAGARWQGTQTLTAG
jgi:glucose-6-phosphate 1-epimerase